MATPSLSFELTSWTGHTVVAPIGEVDFATASQLREYLYALIDAGHGHLLVDLNQVTFLDASGLGVLVGAANRTQPCRRGVSSTASSTTKAGRHEQLVIGRDIQRGGAGRSAKVLRALSLTRATRCAPEPATPGRRFLRGSCDASARARASFVCCRRACSQSAGR